MLFVRWIIIVLLLMAGVSFALYAATGRLSFKRYAIVLLKWLAFAVLVFAVALMVARMH